MVTGGRHASGYTHNALIVFADGAYLELMAPTDPALLKDPPPPGPGNYLPLFEAGEGIAGYAFGVQDLDAHVGRVRQAGIEIGDPQSGGRRRPDGVELRWRTAMFPDMSVPFYLTDETPRADRVPVIPENTKHSNVATGITGIGSTVADPRAAVERYRAVFDMDPVFESQTARFTIKGFTVRLTAGQPGLRGELPTELRLSSSQSGTLTAHGCRLLLEAA